MALQLAEVLYEGLCCLTKIVHKGCDECKLDHCERCGGCGETLCNCLLQGCHNLGSLLQVCCACIHKCSYLSCRECSRDTCGHCFAVDRCCCCCCDICCPANGFTNVLILDMSMGSRGMTSGSSGGTVVVVQPQPVQQPIQVAPAPQKQTMEDEENAKKQPHMHLHHQPHEYEPHNQNTVFIHPPPEYSSQPLNASPPGGPPEGEITAATTATFASDASTLA